MRLFAWAVMNLALSKVVLFIVEGETDELALGAPLNKLLSSFKSSEFRFRVTRGDLITNRSYGSECSPNNVKKRVVEQVKIFLGRYKLKWSDLAAIIYLTDTDGTFIAASSVVQNDELNGISYFLAMSNPLIQHRSSLATTISPLASRFFAVAVILHIQVGGSPLRLAICHAI